MNNCRTCNKFEENRDDFEHWTCDSCKPSYLYLLVCKSCMRKVYHGGNQEFRDTIWRRSYDQHNKNEIHGAVDLI